MNTRAQELLAARARRVTAIRRRVIAAVVASFALAWGVVAWDGSMAGETTASTTQPQTTSEPTTSSQDPWSDQSTNSVPQDNSGSMDDGGSLSTGQS
jgi:hypothetical protein